MKGKEPTFDGARLQAVRKWRGLSVSDVGRMSGVSARHIWRLEANQRPTCPPSPWRALSERWMWTWSTWWG